MKAAYENYFGKPFTTENVTPAEAAIIAGAPEVAVELRPRPQRHRAVHDATSPRTPTAPGSRSSSSPTTRRSSSAATTSCDLLAAGRPHADLGRPVLAPRTSRPPSDDRSSWPARPTPRWIAPHFVWAVRDELTDEAVRPRRRDLRRARARRPAGHDDARRRASRRSPRSGSKAAAIVPHAQGPRGRGRRRSASRRTRAGCSNLENKNVRNGSLVAIDYQTGELVAYVGSADYYATKSSKQFQPQYDVVGHGYPPAGLGVQAVQLRDRHRRREADRRLDAHGQRHGLRRRLHARATPTTSSAARSASATPSSSR